jgi:hypothetical protein
VATALRRWRLAAGLPAGEDVGVPDRLVAGGQFHHAVEEHAAATRVAAVEPEDEFVEVGGQVRFVDGSLMGAQQPPLG